MKTLANCKPLLKVAVLGSMLALNAVCNPVAAQDKNKPATKANTITPAGPKPSLAPTVPLVGAQVWVEPGMDAATIDKQFETLAKHNMPVARLFLVWSWMSPAPGKWDFTLYDNCFSSAAKHKVRIVATLMPNQLPVHAGPAAYYKVQSGAAAPTDRELQVQMEYVRMVVKHYAKHPALDTWMLMNEPGQLPAPDSLALQRFRPWLKAKYQTVEQLNKTWMAAFSTFDAVDYSANWAGGGFTWPSAFVDWQAFWREHLTWYLSQIADNIRKEDATTPLHVNPHALLDIQEKYDLRGWMSFLNSLGASIHPVWHFDAIRRWQFSHGVSMVSDYVRTAANGKDFWITELQGGLDTYTGSRAITPTATEIKHWLWTGAGAGSKRTIFWCLNPRLRGTEAGEWAMVDFQGKPTDRLAAASEVANAIQNQGAFWSKAEPIASQVYLVHSTATMVVQQRAKVPEGNNPARTSRAHKNAVLGTYLALASHGISPQVLDVDDMGWTNKDKRPKLVILPHANALTNEQLQNMRTYVENGGTLLLTGLTGMFDEQEGLRYHQPSVLNQLLGGEVKAVGSKFGADADTEFFLDLEPTTATKAGSYAGYPVWEHKLGAGKVITYAAIAGLDAYLAANAGTAGPTKAHPWSAELLKQLQVAKVMNTPYNTQATPQVVMRSMQHPDGPATLFINTDAKSSATIALTNAPTSAPLELPTNATGKPEIAKLDNGQLTLKPGEVRLLHWTKQ